MTKRTAVPIPPDGLTEFVEDECPTCGAYMLNPALHAEWHERLSAEVREYRPSPRY